MAFPPKKPAIGGNPFAGGPAKKSKKSAKPKGDPKLAAALAGLKSGMGPVGPPQGM